MKSTIIFGLALLVSGSFAFATDAQNNPRVVAELNRVLNSGSWSGWGDWRGNTYTCDVKVEKSASEIKVTTHFKSKPGGQPTFERTNTVVINDSSKVGVQTAFEDTVDGFQRGYLTTPVAVDGNWTELDLTTPYPGVKTPSYDDIKKYVDQKDIFSIDVREDQAKLGDGKTKLFSPYFTGQCNIQIPDWKTSGTKVPFDVTRRLEK